MKDREDEIIASGTQIIWVMSQSSNFGTASNALAQDFYNDTIRSSVGIRVGDDETSIVDAFDTSNFRGGRGLWMVVKKAGLIVEHEDSLGPYPSVDEILGAIAEVD